MTGIDASFIAKAMYVDFVQRAVSRTGPTAAVWEYSGHSTVLPMCALANDTNTKPKYKPHYIPACTTHCVFNTLFQTRPDMRRTESSPLKSEVSS